MAFTKIAAAGIGSTGTVTLENLVVTGSVTGAVTGNATGLSGTPNITVGTIGATSLNASGVVTATTFSGALTGNVTGNATGLSGTPNITVGSIIASNATISGNVSVAGTLTYEDVTNVDSIGIVTARTGVRIDAGGLVVVGVTTVAAGSSAAPSISPTGDSDTGIFFPSADTIAFGEGGAEAFRITSSGNVGIGTNNPTSKLQVQNGGILVKGAATPNINFEPAGVVGNADISFDGTNFTIVSNSSSAAMLFSTNSTERLHITPTGNIGIGTNNPAAKLDVTGGELVVTPNTAGKNTITLTTNAVDDGRILIKSNTTTKVDIQANGASYFNGGNFGIGINNPAEKLHVRDGRLLVETGGSSTYGVISGFPNNNHLHTFRANITGSTSSPTFTLGHQMCFVEYAQDNDSTGWFFKTSATDTYDTVFKISRSNITYPSGNFGIGTNNPTEKLEVSSATASGANISLVKQNSGTANQAGQQLHFYNYAPSNTARAVDTECGLIRFFASQPTSGAAQEMARITAAADVQQTGTFTQGRLTFSTRDATTNNLTERVRIDSSGNVHLSGIQVIKQSNGEQSTSIFSGSQITVSNNTWYTVSNFAFQYNLVAFLIFVSFENNAGDGNNTTALFMSPGTNAYAGGGSQPVRISGATSLEMQIVHSGSYDLQLRTTSSGSGTSDSRLRWWGIAIPGN